MTLPDRGEVEARLQALLADHLDHIAEQNPDGFDIGVAAIVTEVRFPVDADAVEELVASRPRPEARYTPEAELRHYVAVVCSDSRKWIQSGLLSEALDVVEDDGEDDSD